YDPDENDQIYSSDGDNDAFERFNNTRGLCDQFAWNKLSTWFIIYGLISNTPHFTLLSYIGGEFGIRLLFNSRCDPQENNETEHLSTQVSGTQPLNGNPTDDRSFFQKCLDKIYQWDKEFFFSTIKIKDRLFHREIILSAIITALFYTGQLFLGMKYLKKDIKKYRTIGRYMLIEEKGIKIKEIPSKAIRYPGYLIQFRLTYIYFVCVTIAYYTRD
ncbi:unnamed protein product, partial [Rotaria sp. Silwood1]